MELRLDNKVAIVTGASRGIGQAIASTFAAAGASVVLTSRKIDALEAAADQIVADTGVDRSRLEVIAANAGDPAAAQAVVAKTIERFGAVDILVNNAATNPYYGPSLGVTESQYDKTFQVNLRGPVFWCKEAWDQSMHASQDAVIINIASVGGLRAEGALGIYNLTKAALIHFTRQLAGELGPHARVVGIAPGLVQTDFAKVLVDNFGTALARRMPTKRLGLPQDIANMALFLASDKASWITGETYVVDGGAGVAPSA